MFEQLQALSQNFIKLKYESYRRYFIQKAPLKHRFSIILGERGIGKTTTLIQYLIDAAGGDPLSDTILYIQADHFLIGTTSLYEIAQTFTHLGGKQIAFDEIHKYPNWSVELKSIYDTFPDLRIIASGSSALEIHKGSHDLARRATVYRMFGLSLREFIELKYTVSLPAYNLKDLVANHTKIAFTIMEKLEHHDLKILKLFKEYLEYGYYPYFRLFESKEEYQMTVTQNLHTTIESDLAAIYPRLTGNSIKKIKQLMTYLAQAVPFIPNWQNIKNSTEIGDDRTLKTYFKYLEDAYIICMLELDTDTIKRIEDPGKIYLGNTNQLYAFGFAQPSIGNVHETFFMSSVRAGYHLAIGKDADFVVDHTFTFEIGGKNKDTKQIRNTSLAYLAVDDIEHGSGQRIPLWLFGFLY